VLLKVHDVSTTVIERVTNLCEASLPFLVEISSFVTVAFSRIVPIDDLVDAFQSLCDLGVFRHPQSIPSQRPVMMSRNSTRMSFDYLPFGIRCVRHLPFLTSEQESQKATFE